MVTYFSTKEASCGRQLVPGLLYTLHVRNALLHSVGLLQQNGVGLHSVHGRRGMRSKSRFLGRKGSLQSLFSTWKIFQAKAHDPNVVLGLGQVLLVRVGELLQLRKHFFKHLQCQRELAQLLIAARETVAHHSQVFIFVVLSAHVCDFQSALQQMAGLVWTSLIQVHCRQVVHGLANEGVTRAQTQLADVDAVHHQLLSLGKVARVFMGNSQVVDGSSYVGVIATIQGLQQLARPPQRVLGEHEIGHVQVELALGGQQHGPELPHLAVSHPKAARVAVQLFQNLYSSGEVLGHPVDLGQCLACGKGHVVQWAEVVGSHSVSTLNQRQRLGHAALESGGMSLALKIRGQSSVR
eukprot:m.250123 g.250123  ORF g.250123 m.250123 type:complete len:352 (-) comp22636_c0_seq3:4923-5978(-)